MFCQKSEERTFTQYQFFRISNLFYTFTRLRKFGRTMVLKLVTFVSLFLNAYSVNFFIKSVSKTLNCLPLTKSLNRQCTNSISKPYDIKEKSSFCPIFSAENASKYFEILLMCASKEIEAPLNSQLAENNL